MDNLTSVMQSLVKIQKQYSTMFDFMNEIQKISADQNIPLDVREKLLTITGYTLAKLNQLQKP